MDGTLAIKIQNHAEVNHAKPAKHGGTRGGKKMIELKPCPFCGGRANIVQESTGADRDVARIRFGIECSKCRTTFRRGRGAIEIMLKDGEIYVTKDERHDIARMWNRRYTGDEYSNEM